MASAQQDISGPKVTHSGLLNQVTSLQCPICYRFMTEPKILSCGHTFCLTCLSKIVHKKKLSCALCRKETKITNGDAASLTTNIAFRSVVEEVANLDGKCDVCDSIGKPNEIAYCHDCNMFMCRDCKVKHDGKNENSNHAVKSPRRSKYISSFRIGTKYCAKHELVVCTEICLSCTEYVCKECLVIHNNKKHTVLTLVGYATVLHANATPLAKDIKGVKKTSTDFLQQCENHQERTIKHIDMIISEINDEYKASMERLEEKKTSLIKPCLDLKENICKMSEEVAERIEKCNSRLDITNLSIQGVLESPFKDIPTHDSILDKSQFNINDIRTEAKLITENSKDMFKEGDALHFIKKCEHDADPIGELTTHIWVRTSFPLTMSAKCMTSMTVDHRGHVLVGYFNGGVESIRERSPGVAVDNLKQVCVMAMAICNDGKVVIRDVQNNIFVYGLDFNKSNAKFETIGHTEGGDGDLALDTNNDIYASYRATTVIHMYRKTGGNAIREIQCNGFNPQQIVVMPNLDIVVMNASTIKIIDANGATKSEIIRKGLIGYPTVAWDGTLLISWIKPGGRSVELVKFTHDLKNKEILHFDNDIDLSGRQWFHCRVLGADKIVLCCPEQLHIFTLHVKTYPEPGRPYSGIQI